MKRLDESRPWAGTSSKGNPRFASSDQDRIGLRRLAEDLDEIARALPGVGRLCDRLSSPIARSRRPTDPECLGSETVEPADS